MPSRVRTFSGAGVTGEILDSFGTNSSVTGKKRLGAAISFRPPGVNSTQIVVESKIGISFISAQKACDFVDREIPSTNSFTSLVNSARQAWNNEIFSTVTTTEVSFERPKTKRVEVYERLDEADERDIDRSRKTRASLFDSVRHVSHPIQQNWGKPEMGIYRTICNSAQFANSSS